MKIGIIIPDRGDRPKFLENCLRMIDNQTIKPERITIPNFQPEGDVCDITRRYKHGYFHLMGKDLDLIAFMENDDWYASDYLEYMSGEWEKAGRPDLLGTNYTIYYHLKLKKYFTMRHASRASAMNTFIRPELFFDWCPNHEPYTDTYLWVSLEKVWESESGKLKRDIIKKVIEPSHIISVGIKHAIGKTGGHMHNTRMHRYINKDNGFLKNTLDAESFAFYNSMFGDEIDSK